MFNALAALAFVASGLFYMVGAYGIAQRAFALGIVLVFLSPLLDRIFSGSSKP